MRNIEGLKKRLKSRYFTYLDKDESNYGKNFHCTLIGWYKYFTAAKKSELKFYEDK